MQENEHIIYKSTLLNQLDVAHGYSTRGFGDLRWNKNRQTFLTTLGMAYENLVMGEQVHGIRIAHVDDHQKGKIIPGTDGLISRSSGILLGVTFADCVPLLAIDQKAGVIGTAHAGWKGTLAGIAREFIDHMKNEGADIKNIYVSIGPHIGMCCYNVDEGRARAFQNRFGMNEKIASQAGNDWHLDIGMALSDAGVPQTQIDVSEVCTACHVDSFNSFRRDTKEAFGVQLGVISL